MDSSTHNQCLEITAAFGGDSKEAALTGSAATERFAGPQQFSKNC
jgi:sugar (pentulose or hexulose) kinase